MPDNGAFTSRFLLHLTVFNDLNRDQISFPRGISLILYTYTD